MCHHRDFLVSTVIERISSIWATYVCDIIETLLFLALFGVFRNPCHYLDELLGVFLKQCHCFGNILMCANISISSYHYLKHFEIYASVGSLLFLALLEMFRNSHYYLGNIWICQRRDFVVFTTFGSILKCAIILVTCGCVIIGLCCFHHYLGYLGSKHHYKLCLALSEVDDSLILCYFIVIKEDLFA